MLIGLCGSISAGKQSVATYLIERQGFSRLCLAPPAPTIARSVLLEQHCFDTVEKLVDYITKRWQQRWVTTDIWNEDILEKLLRRPSFLLVSVDAPLTLRWQRYKSRCGSAEQPGPSLEEFVQMNDDHLYHYQSGSAQLIDRAGVRLVNRSLNLDQLHQTLAELDLPNEKRLRPDWDQYFMQLASLAAQRSNCMKRRVGSVLVREKRVISTGYNGTPRNLKNCNEGGCQWQVEVLRNIAADHVQAFDVTKAVWRALASQPAFVYTQKKMLCSKQTAAVFAEGGVKLRRFSPPHKGLVMLKSG
ncbi:MAG: hypothetical protein Q9212_000417 [Teloschistes hypoglaucus]